MSYNLSRKGNINKPKEREEIISQLDKDYTVEKDDLDNQLCVAEDLRYEEPKSTTSINNTVRSIVTEKSLILEDGGEIQITFIEKEEDGRNVGPYDYIFDMLQEPQELQVIVYKNHPLWRKRIDGEVRKIIATSDSIYRMLVEQLNIDCRKALSIRNEWVLQRTESM